MFEDVSRDTIHWTMRPKLLAFSLVVGVLSLVFVACTTDYQMGLEDPKFGAPNALAGQKQPGPSSATTSDGGGAARSTPECVKAGGTLVDAGPCTVSFKTDILGAFQAANCQTAGSCHGGASPPNQPRIEPTDPGIWHEFASFKLSNGRLYINPCSTDPAQSTIACNVSQTAPCGSIMPPGIGLSADVVTKVETWLKCGAPNN